MSSMYSCPACLKSFDCLQYLRSHLSGHAGELENQCVVCNKTFKTISGLSDHLKSHAGGDGNYQCSICDKKFTNKKAFQRHIRTHTGKTAYQCDLCSKTFTQSSHQRTRNFTEVKKNRNVVSVRKHF